jgi:predicted PurR-regulated permease PerM
MADRPGDSPGVAAARRAFFVLGTATLVVVGLSWGQKVFVTLALAVLLTLLLGPVVSFLERRGLRRFPAVLSTALLAFLLIGLLGWAVTVQVSDLLSDLPRHRADLRARLDASRAGDRPGPLAAFKELLTEVESGGRPVDPAEGPVIRVEPARPSAFTQLRPVLGPVLWAVSGALAVVLLVITLLLYREDTRNRLIRLAGRGRLAVTTRALDEAGRRIGGYLLGHAAVNAAFGAAMTLGLFLLGVPHPALWGLLSAALRFVPSVGVWLVAPLPAAVAWLGGTAHPLLVLALFLVLELATANVVEPRVCGRSIGLAPVPLFLAITFWTGMWGIIGLVLATPVTVCLAVLGKYVPALRFLAILLGRESALRPAARYYQRLLAGDRYEAEAVVKEYLAEHAPERLFDRVLVPALVLVRRGKRAGELRPEDEAAVLQATRDVVAAVDLPAADPDPAGGVVLGVPATDGVDEVALEMFGALARVGGIDLTVAADGAGVAALVQEAAPAAVLVAAVGPGGLIEAGYLCRRLRAQQPGLKIVVGRWGGRKDPTRARAALLAAGADRVTATMRDARTQLGRLVHTSMPAGDDGRPEAELVRTRARFMTARESPPS